MSPREFINAYQLIKNSDKLQRLMDVLEEYNIAKTPELRELIEDKIRTSGLKARILSPLLEHFEEAYPMSMFCEQAIGTQYIPETALPSSVTTVLPPFVPSANPGFEVPKETLGSYKYIYGTYLEMAFHNFYLNMKHIYALVFGLDILEEAKQAYRSERNQEFNGDFANEEYVWQPMFADFRDARPEEQQKLEQLIDRHFPFVKVVQEFIHEKDDKNKFTKFQNLSVFDILERLSVSLRILRNFYSHFDIKLHPNQISDYIQNELLLRCVIKATYNKSIDIVKERFNLSKEDLEFSKCKNADGSRKENFKYYVTDKSNQHLTQFGLIMLTSLFLEKQYSKILLDKSGLISSMSGYENVSTATPEQKYVPEIIAVYRLRIHTEKLHVVDNADALAFDMLTELRRCPIELYDHLTPKEQKAFRIKNEDNNDDEVLLLRHRDRFATLAMKYIDYGRLFQRVRFQVSLGNYFFKFYNKYCIDGGEARVRCLSKHVNGFGRIDEIDEARLQQWNTQIRTFDTVHKNTAEEMPYVTDQYPQYTEADGHIAMRIFDPTEEPLLHVPTLEADGVRNLEPTCRLSTYALPAMMMLMYLEGAEWVEQIIIEAVDSYHRLFQDVAEGRLQPVDEDEQLQEVLNQRYPHIQLQDVPEDLRIYLTGYQSDAKALFGFWAEDTIDKLINETQSKLQQISKANAKPQRGKSQKAKAPTRPSLKPGKMAEFLAKDIMRFQPFTSENKGKLTGLNFSVFQAEMATYQGDTAHLSALLKQAHIIETPDKRDTNPIVSTLHINGIKSTEQFYRLYLNARLKYLKQCKQEQDYANYPFLHANQTRWQEHTPDFYRQKAARYLHDTYGGVTFDKAIELPRGLFDEPLRRALSQTAVGAMAQDPTKNIAYLIYAFCRREMNDECQPMYMADRNYTLFDRLPEKKPKEKQYLIIEQLRNQLLTGSKQSFKKQIAVAVERHDTAEQKEFEAYLKRLLAEMKDNETLLKRYRVQDIVLFLLAKNILTKDQQDKERMKAFDQLKLQDMQNPGALEQKISLNVKVQSQKGFNKTIVQDDLKLKNYAQFYRFLNDRRIPSLLDLVRENVISRQKIDEELAGYETAHPKVMEKVMQFEEKFLRKHNESDWQRTGENLAFWRMLQEVTGIENNPMAKVRNAFAHAIYPKKWDISETAQQTPLPEKAKQIGDDFNQKIDSVI